MQKIVLTQVSVSIAVTLMSATVMDTDTSASASASAVQSDVVHFLHQWHPHLSSHLHAGRDAVGASFILLEVLAQSASFYTVLVLLFFIP